MAAPNPLTLTRKSPVLFRLMSFSRISTCHFTHHAKIPAYNNTLLTKRSFVRSCTKLSLRSTGGCGLSRRSRFGFSLSGLRSSRRFSGFGGRGSGSGGIGGGNSAGGGAGSSGDGGGGANSLLSWYLSLLAKYPVMTKAITSALLTLVGDVTCQLVIDQVPSLDLKRTFSFTFLGLALVGPTLHFWYLYLSKLVTTPGASGALLRLLLDQFLFSPIFIGVFLSTLVTLEGNPSLVIPKLRQEWFSSVVANWQLWIPFQFLNFRFVPQQFQVLAANFIALIWNVILSYKAHKEVVAK